MSDGLSGDTARAPGVRLDYFERMYAAADDPWGFASRWYEERKYALTLAALPNPRFRSAFEPGCSIGVLTGLLAARCDRLLATDIVEAPLAAARQRVAALDHVEIRRLVVPEQWPTQTFDLVVLSEIGYYFERHDLDRVVAATTQSLDPDGCLVAVHWRHPVAEYPLTGDDVHETLAAADGLTRVSQHVERDFLLDVFVTRGPHDQA
ncbi:class I SAM-dependent DNA methyltransferase [Pseudofrankia inefficax]|uniref:Methyltransferase type 12 n=1 Tax=Pseudofrankia inefficax (strain DSM 45817 / CECT 9037 / DDB 130130 / EuI1c) TaxID=298654 RepID=E3J8H7_PSEI1|nr:SAM-dependent methyltransferase [Pseudofrankia inefficax]ADP84511.1 Methyltransferase type 12 [Pseudofrankia inefficax]